MHSFTVQWSGNRTSASRQSGDADDDWRSRSSKSSGEVREEVTRWGDTDDENAYSRKEEVMAESNNYCYFRFILLSIISGCCDAIKMIKIVIDKSTQCV